MTHHEPITAARARQLFHYDPDSGFLTWKVRLSPRRGPGEVAGHLDNHGYLRVRIGGQRYMVHRIIWLWIYGEWPANQIDHRDRNRSNNRSINLRKSTSSENQYNRAVSKNNRSGIKWVSWDTHQNRWAWQVECRGTATRGYSNCPAASHFAAIVAADKLHGEFMRCNARHYHRED